VPFVFLGNKKTKKKEEQKKRDTFYPRLSPFFDSAANKQTKKPCCFLAHFRRSAKVWLQKGTEAREEFGRSFPF
jgi:hypothetical protein